MPGENLPFFGVILSFQAAFLSFSLFPYAHSEEGGISLLPLLFTFLINRHRAHYF